jgi:DNA-binding transcriptional LysR family regulator
MARINSRQVEAFRATMLTGSVTEAANLMAVTQPAVSRLLRDFQALLKMELFERRGTGLVPTAAATALYTEVERSFVGLERITAAAEEIRSRRTGTLRIAALPALSNGYLPRLAGQFLKERPNLNLAFFGVISPIVVDWVLNNQCDIGFAEVPIAHGLPSCDCRLCRASRCCLPDIVWRQGTSWSHAISRARRSCRFRRGRRAGI